MNEQPYKILLVEDEAIIAMSETQMLKRHGYEVVTAQNGERAIEAVESDPGISLILMDIDLGCAMDGTEAAERILATHDLPIAFLSSHTEPELVKKTEGITSYGYIVKNSGETVLVASIKMAFRLYEAHRELIRQKEDLNTALKKYEQTAEALSAKNEELEHYFTSSLDMLCIADTDGRFIRMNPEWEKVLGYSVADLEGQMFLDFVHSEDREATSQAVARLDAGEDVTSFENRFRSRDGSYRWIEWRSRPIGTTIYAAARDITERKQAEETLIEREALYRNLMENSIDGVELLDEEGNYLNVNQKECEMLGYSREELLKMKIADIDPNYPEEGFYHFWKEQPKGTSILFETLHRHKDGTLIPVEVNGIFFTVNEKKYIFGVARDIRERKRVEYETEEREENLRITLSSIGDAVISTDIEGNIVRMNPVAESLCGWTIDGAKGKALKDVFHIVHADTREKVENPVARVLETGNVIGLANHTMLISKDGTEYQIADSAAPIRGDNGHTTGVVLVFRDVTEEYRKEKQLQQRVRELRSIEWMLSKRTTQQEEHIPEYGDLSKLNRDGLIVHSVRKEQLRDVASEYLDLLETSTAIYEKDGSYALGIFASGWCRLMDSASRRLCNTEDNREALESGKWLCHESCWNAAVLAMKEDRPAEIECNGGIRMYAVPVHAQGETVGAINFGFGSPPTAKEELETLSQKYKIPVDELRKQAEAYNPRPQFIIDYAKERIHVAAKQLGRMLDLKRKEDELEKKSTLLGESQVLANLGSWEWDPVDDTWEFSEQWKKIHGVSDDNPNTSKLFEIAHPEDAPYIEKALCETREEAKTYNIQHRIIRPDNNETRYIHALGEVEYSRDTNRPIRVIGIAQDITERKQAEEGVQRLLVEKETLLKEVHHRLKNNLAQVESLLSIQADSADNADVKSALNKAISRVRSSRTLYEKLIVGESYEEVSMRDYLESLIDSLAEVFNERSSVTVERRILDFALEPKKAVPVGIITNELLTNVFKYAFAGRSEGRVSIDLEKTGNQVILTVWDDGVGSDKGVDTNKSPGFGLTIVKMLAEQLGGTFTNENNNGTRSVLEFEM